jgi:hypothetical protein
MNPGRRGVLLAVAGLAIVRPRARIRGGDGLEVSGSTFSLEMRYRHGSVPPAKITGDGSTAAVGQ